MENIIFRAEIMRIQCRPKILVRRGICRRQLSLRNPVIQFEIFDRDFEVGFGLIRSL